MSEKHNILLHDYNFTFASNKQQIVLRMSYFSASLRYSLVSSVSSLAGISLESINQALEYVKFLRKALGEIPITEISRHDVFFHNLLLF